MNHKSILIIIIVLLIIPFFSISSQNDDKNKDNKPQNNNTYKIGSIQSLTGELSYQGKSISDSIKLFFDLVNDKGGFKGQKVEIIEYDDGNNPSISLEMAKKLVEKDNVRAIIGGPSASTALSVMDYISKKNIPYLHYGGGNVELLENAGENVFFLKPTVTMEAMILAQFAYSQLYASSIMVIYQNDDTGLRSRNAIRAYVDLKGIGIISEVSASEDQIPYHIILNEVINNRPDAIIMFSYMSETNEILKHLRGHQIDIPVILPSYNLDYISIGTIGKENWNNTYSARWFKSPTSEEVKEFVSTFKENMLAYPNYYHSIGWALSQVIYESMIRTSFGSINRGLKSLYSYDLGISSRIDFYNSYNVGIDSMYFVGFKEQSFYELNTYITPDIIAYYKESSVMGYVTEGYEVKENVIDENYTDNLSIILEKFDEIKKIEDEKAEKENEDSNNDNEEENMSDDTNQQEVEDDDINDNLSNENENTDLSQEEDVEENNDSLSNPISGDDIEQRNMEEETENENNENDKSNKPILYEDSVFLMVGNWESVSIGSKLKDTKYDGKILLKLKEDNRYYMDIDYPDQSYTENINGYWEIVNPEVGKKYLLLDQFIPQENICKAYLKIMNYGRTLKLIIAEDDDINGVGLNPDLDSQKLIDPFTIEFTRALVN